MAYQRFRGDTLTSLSDPNRGATSKNWVTPDAGLVNDAYAVQETLPTSTSSTLANRKRKQSKGKAVKSSSRSMSTPQIQRPGMSDSDIDKKRNKLGYQRISIACAHCRRRKIRCIVDENDPHERCQNCIRLKKECLFYPVDQQSAVEEKSQASSKAGRSSTVSSSPTGIHSATTFDNEDSNIEFSTFPSSLPPNYQGTQLTPGSAPIHQGSFSQHYFDYPQRSASHSPWSVPNEFGPQMHETRPSPSPYVNQQHWHLNQTASPGDFSTFPLDAAQQAFPPHHASIPGYAPQGVDNRWPHPVRSYSHEQMTRSISNDESMYAGGFPSYAAQSALPLQMGGQGGEMQHAAASQHERAFSSSAQPYHDSMIAQPAPQRDWYGDSAAYGQMSEQRIGPPTEDFTRFQR